MALNDKLFEEVHEMRDARPENRLAALADGVEVVRRLSTHLGMTDVILNALAADRRAERCGYNQRLWPK